MWPSTWIDERGSEVLEAPECRRLLALGAKEGRHGHVAVAENDVPVVLPVDYAVYEGDIVVLVGEGLFHRLDGRLVAFQVDGEQEEKRGISTRTALWSVLAQGLASETLDPEAAVHLPHPHVARPGRRLVRIRTDVLSGRRVPDQSEVTGVR